MNNNLVKQLVMWITTLGQAAIALYLPAFPAIANTFHSTPVGIKTTITLFLIGYGASQLIYGPLSDRYGRKKLLLIGIALFCIGCLISIFAHSLSVFLFSRLLQGLGAGSTITLGRSIFRDCFEDAALASANSYLSMGFAIGVGTTPIIGAYLQNVFGWRADFVFLFLVGAILFYILWKFLPETLQKITPPQSEVLFLKNVFKNYVTILCNLTFLRFSLAGVCAYGVVISYNVMSPFLIQGKLHISVDAYGWLALLVAIPYYTAASMNRSLVMQHGMRPIFNSGVACIVGSGVVMALTYFYPATYLVFIIIPVMIATFGQAMIFPNTISGALQHYPAYLGGAASGLFSALQLLCTAALSALLAFLPDSTQLPLAVVLIGLGIASWVLLQSHR